MARKKNAKSLFEVISRDAARVGKADKTGRQPLGVPGWFGRAEPTQTYAPEPEAPPAAQVAPEEARKPAPPPGEPIIAIASGRLRISLNQVSAAVLGLAVVLLLLGAFFLGRRTAPARPEIAAAPPTPGKQETIEQELAGPLPALPPQPKATEQLPKPPPETERPVRKKDYWYLVIQAGISTKPQADDIKSFLADRGIASSVHRSQNTRKWMVRDLRGYADKRSNQADDYKNGVEQLGKEYFQPARNRLYDFQGCYYSLEQ